MLVAAIAVPPARATTFVLPDTADLFAVSDAVVLGDVRTIRSVNDRRRLHTRIIIDVEKSVKGWVSSEIAIVEPGGLVGNQRRWIHGAPTFFVGERVLLFLRLNAQHEFETTFLATGKFSVVRSSSGAEFAVRNLGDARVLAPSLGRFSTHTPVSTYTLQDLLAVLPHEGGDLDRSSEGHIVTQPLGTAAGSRWQDNFTFSGPPLTRWLLPDDGSPIAYQVSESGDSALGVAASTDAADAALAAWSNVECANLRLVDGGPAPPASFGDCDGRTQITFDDPFDEMPDPVNCTGVLGVGGVCADASVPETFNGIPFSRITEGDVVVNNGFGGCPFWNTQNLAELLTHEIGHTLGLSHSSNSPDESDPSLRDATMYYAAHFDGRGAALKSDDVAAICALYPAGRTGSVTLRRFAIVSDSSRPSPSDRLVVDGLLILDNGRFDPHADTLIIDLLSAGTSVFRLAIMPGESMISASGTRLRYRPVSEAGVTTLTVSAIDSGALRFSIRARGLDLSSAQSDPMVMSLALGGANVTQPVPLLRPRSRSRIYP